MAIETIVAAVHPDTGTNEAVVDHVLDLASPIGATVVIAFVQKEAAYDATIEDLKEEASMVDIARRNLQVRDTIDRLKSTTIQHEVRADIGDPGPSFVAIAESVDADIVCIPGEARSPTGKALFGNVRRTSY